MDKKIRDSVDNIVRYIPIKKIRDSIRELIFFRLETLSDIKNLIEFRLIDKEIVIKTISGGLTDQFFHYIYGRHIELKYNRQVKYDITCYGENINGIRNSNRNFELQNLFPDLNLEIASDSEIVLYKELYNAKDTHCNTFNDYLITMKQIYIGHECTPYQGYQEKSHNIVKTELNFDKYVYPLLKDENLDYYNEIKSSDVSIGIHVRRGDYVGHPRSIVDPDENYFTKAIELISTKVDIKKAKLFFFSDSMDWVSEHIVPKIKNKYSYVLVDGNDDASGYLDFYLLMSTQHQIASVGRFCHLAHFFNSYKDKLIIARSKTMKPEILYNFVLPT